MGGVFEEGLGGDAAPVEAGAAGAIGLDAGDFFTELGGGFSELPDDVFPKMYFCRIMSYEIFHFPKLINFKKPS